MNGEISTDDDLPDLEDPSDDDSLDIDQHLTNLIHSRNQFENQVYDYLLNPNGIVFVFTETDDSFWDPVVVPYLGVHLLKWVNVDEICTVCTDNCFHFKIMSCCSQKMCNSCSYSWFERSVKCPYCYQDLRDFEYKLS